MDFEKEQVWRRLSSLGNYQTFYCQASDSEKAEFRQWVKSLMWENEVLIEFAKADGTIRAMRCTLTDLYGAKYPDNSVLVEKSNSKNRQQNDHVCSVWDIEKNAWRSFRWDRLRTVEFKIG